MLFNSWLFLLFFLCVIILYRMLGHRSQNRMLLIMSYVFYGTWDWRFLSLIVISSIVDYVVGQQLNMQTGRKKRQFLLITSLGVNLGILAFFKYYGFFIDQIVHLLSSIGFSADLPTLRIILPVGISFYTFQTMSYTVDVFKGKTKTVNNFLDFALYVAFFPQLVAGPIERSSHFMPQVLNPRTVSREDFKEGFYLVLLGFFKKIVIADNMAIIANAFFNADSSMINGAASLVGVYAFAFQIYGDFSGYSAIARGISKWLGFDLIVNFRMPYFAISPKDFWSRWHISLSTWLRDYLYIPLGGNKGVEWKIYRNLLLTMLLGGLWHGAGWNFIVWGIFHGVILIIYRLLSKRFNVDDANRRPFFVNLLCGTFMFHLVCVTWLLFRADNIAHAWYMFIAISTNFTCTPLVLSSFCMIVFYCTPLMLYEYWLERNNDLLALMKSSWKFQSIVYVYLFGMLLLFHPIVTGKFIYFQF